MAQPKEIWPLGPAKKHSCSKGITGAGPLHTFDPKQRVGTFPQPRLYGCAHPSSPWASPPMAQGKAPTSPQALQRQQRASLPCSGNYRQLLTTWKRWLFCLEAWFFFFFPPSIFGKAETPPQAWPRKKGRKYQGAHRAGLTTEGENKILKDVGDVLAASTFQSAFVLLGLEALQSTASPPTIFTVAVTGQLIKNWDKISIANESLTSVSSHTAQLWLSTTGHH